MKPLRVEFDMTKADLLAVADVLAARDAGVIRAIRKTRTSLLLMMAFLLVPFGAVFALQGLNVAPLVVAVPISVGVLALALPTTHRMGQRIRKSMAANLATPAGRAYLGWRVLEVGAEGLMMESSYSTARIGWRGVVDLVPTADHLFIVLPGPGYLPVPAAAFGNHDDFDRFVDGVTELCAAGGGLTARPGLGEPGA